jgi:hypothetical protein
MPVPQGYDPETAGNDTGPSKGVYMVTCTKAYEKETKAGDTASILEFQIVEGDFKGFGGRDLTEWMCTNHANPMTKKIANKKLKGFFVGAGMPDEKDTDALLNKVFKAHITPKVDGEYTNYNLNPIWDQEKSDIGATPTVDIGDDIPF